MKNNELKIKKYNEIVEMYEKLLKTNISINSIVEKISNTPLSKWYISEDEACRNISAIENNKFLGKKHEMYYDLYNEYLKLKIKYPKRKMRDLILEVLDTIKPNKPYYLSKVTIRKIYSDYIKKQKNNGKN